MLEFKKEGILNVKFPGSEPGSGPEPGPVSESEPERDYELTPSCSVFCQYLLEIIYLIEKLR